MRFTDLVEQAHTAGVALLRNDLVELPNVYIDNGEVRLNLVPVINDALRHVAVEIRDFLPDVTLPDVVSGRCRRWQTAAGRGRERATT